MERVFIGLFMVLHGLVHVWYFVLARGLVEFRPDMAWTGRSWLLSNFLAEPSTRALASALYIVAAVAFVVAGIGLFARTEWWRPILVGSAVYSSVIILLFWDGEIQMLIQKGLLGLLLNAVILGVLLTR